MRKRYASKAAACIATFSGNIVFCDCETRTVAFRRTDAGAGIVFVRKREKVPKTREKTCSQPAGRKKLFTLGVHWSALHLSGAGTVPGKAFFSVHGYMKSTGFFCLPQRKKETRKKGKKEKQKENWKRKKKKEIWSKKRTLNAQKTIRKTQV